jgi:cell division protein FtsL
MANNEDLYEDDYGYEDGPSAAKSLKGYKMIVLLLAVILVAVSGLYFYQSHQLKADFAIERDTLTNRFQALSDDFSNLETTNLALGDSIVRERGRTDSVLQALAKERNLTRATIRRYEKELGTMRQVMAGYIYTIDSLGRLNQRLASENVTIKREIASERLRADAAEERADDADIKIRQGSRIRAGGVRLALLNGNNREVTRVRNAARLRVDLTLAANDLAQPGTRDIYAIVKGPEGYVLANPQSATFDFEGERTVYSAVRPVDYAGNDLEVSIYYEGGALTAGTYRMEIYVDGMLAGSGESLLR